MQKVLLIGSGGSGKTTFAKALSDKTGLPLIHLDSLYWRPGWKETPKDEWQTIIDGILNRSSWIMDGNYGGTLNHRLAACDTIILLDTSTWKCLYRVLKRTIQHSGHSRQELAPDCPERFDLKFLWWVATYRMKRLPSVLSRLSEAKAEGKRVVILRDSSEAQRFLSEAPPNNSFKPSPLRGLGRAS